MEWVTGLVQSVSDNIGEVVFFILVLYFLVRKGIFSYDKNGIKIGGDERERTILRRQSTFIHGRMDAIANKLCNEHPSYNPYRTMWICKCVELEWVRSIQYNHIEDTEGYKNDRITAIRDLVQKKADDEFFFSEQFESFLKEHVDDAVRNLVRIRSQHTPL